jgi:hypothetical protein
MMRIIVRSDYAGMAVNIGGAVETEFKTFDVDLPEVEQYLRAVKDNPKDVYSQRQVAGVELKA